MQDKIQIKTIAVYDFQQKVFWFLIACIAFTSVFYMYIVTKTVVSIVDRRSAETSLKDIGSKISDLESQYIALGRSVDISEAENLGFHAVSRIDYVSRSSALTMRDR